MLHSAIPPAWALEVPPSPWGLCLRDSQHLLPEKAVLSFSEVGCLNPLFLADGAWAFIPGAFPCQAHGF